MAVDINSRKVSVTDQTKKLKELVAYRQILNDALYSVRDYDKELVDIMELLKTGWKIPDNHLCYFESSNLTKMKHNLEDIYENLKKSLLYIEGDIKNATRTLISFLGRLKSDVNTYNGQYKDIPGMRINFYNLECVQKADEVLSSLGVY